jgi:nicotinate-nucleotide pyrophosphorylase
VLELVVLAEVLDVFDTDDESSVSSGGAFVKLLSKLKEVGTVSEGSTLRSDARLVWASGGGSKVSVLERAMKSELAWLSSVAVVVKIVVS